MTKTFTEIQQRAAKLDLTGHNGLGQRIDHVLDSARINADDTVYAEKASNDWNSIAIASIEMILSYSDDTKAIAWFRKQGITF